MMENLIVSGVNEEERETENSLYETLIALFATEMPLVCLASILLGAI